MDGLTKSSILALRQCRRRLWLALHRPREAAPSADAEARIRAGRQVGEIGRRLYDPYRTGTLVDRAGGEEGALARTAELLKGKRPVFEAGFRAAGITAFADVLLPHRKGLHAGWRLVEVKSTTGVEPHHLEDVAVQSYVATAAGLRLGGILIAHVDGTWSYPGGGNHRGLLVEKDVSAEARRLHAEVPGWIAQAEAIAGMHQEPEVRTGRHCHDPHDCAFLAHCRSREPAVAHPVRWLPAVRARKLVDLLANPTIQSMEQVPDELLNAQQLRVKRHSLAGTEFFDAAGSAQALRGYGPPAYFLDFETVQFAVPVWAGTRPYQQVPFQFSVHVLARDEGLAHLEHVDLSGFDPRRRLAEALLAACGERGPVFAYNAAFEKRVVHELADAFDDLRRALVAVAARLVDLQPIAEAHYYHPSQQGSWSLKRVLPAIARDLSHAALDGVADGNAASRAYLEAIAPETDAPRRAAIEAELRRYCGLDTYGLVRLYAKLAGRTTVTA